MIKKVKSLLVLTLSSLLFITFFSIQSSGQVTKKQKKRRPAATPVVQKRPPSLHVFGGIEGGYSWITEKAAGEIDKDGTQFDAKALLRKRWRYSAVSGGLGYLLNDIYGETEDRKGEVHLKTAFAELNFEYYLFPRVSLGPSVNYLFGTDTSFSEVVGEQSSSLWIGPQLFFDLSEGNYPIRLVASLMTDLTIPERQPWVLQGGIQIGFPLESASKTRSVTKSQTGVPEPEPEVRISLDISRVWFRTDRDKLQPDALAALERLGRFLAQQSDDWQRLQIDGHTDERGTYEYNYDLSLRRAESVAGPLRSQGVSSDKIEVRAFSFTRPILDESNEEAWARNRRVELRFFGVKDPRKFQSLIEPLLQQQPQIDPVPEENIFSSGVGRGR